MSITNALELVGKFKDSRSVQNRKHKPVQVVAAAATVIAVLCVLENTKSSGSTQICFIPSKFT